MVKHNNNISTGHFRKHWQSFVKTWFSQPAKKIRRKNKRIGKKKNFCNNFAYFKKFFPLVHCPTRMYNMKIRFGRGFSLYEINKAKINKNYANSIGIKVDKRRRTKSLFEMYNSKRLVDYLKKILLLNKKDKKENKKYDKIYPLDIQSFTKKKLINSGDFSQVFKNFLEENNFSEKNFQFNQ
nr:60S ribosomal protein L13 [Cryptomonas curvata]